MPLQHHTRCQLSHETQVTYSCPTAGATDREGNKLDTAYAWGVHESARPLSVTLNPRTMTTAQGRTKDSEGEHEILVVYLTT